MGYREKQTVYLYPVGNCRYGAVISSGKPPLVGIARLTDVGNYPVDVLYSRIDCSGSYCYERDTCETPTALLDLLERCGSNRYVIHRVWDFDLDTTENKALYTLFQNVRRKRLTQAEERSNKI